MPNPRLPGTAFISRLISKRFQIVDPKVSGVVDGDVQPVFVVGDQRDETGLAVRAWAVCNTNPAVVGRFSFLGVEVFAPALFELVIHSITVYESSGSCSLYAVQGGTMGGGSTLALSYAEGGRAQAIPTGEAVQQVFDAAGFPAGASLLDQFTTVAGVGEITHRYPGGIIVRPQGGVMLIRQAANAAVAATFRGSVRPLSG